jgi:hypothetical protein
VVCLAPRAPGQIVRPRRSSGVVVRPLNFTVSGRFCLAPRVGVRYAHGLARRKQHT